VEQQEALLAPLGANWRTGSGGGGGRCRWPAARWRSRPEVGSKLPAWSGAARHENVTLVALVRPSREERW